MPDQVPAKLDRLRHLVQLRAEFAEDLNDAGRRLVDHSIFATYRDCVSAGAATPAIAILREARDV